MKSRFLNVLFFVLAAGCGVKSDSSKTQSQVEGCPATYAPIAVDITGVTLTNYAEATKRGELTFERAEIYFETSERGVPKVQFHTSRSKEVDSVKGICMTNSLPSGSEVQKNGIILPISSSVSGTGYVTFSNAFGVDAGSEEGKVSYHSKMDETLGMFISPDEILAKQGVTNYRLYKISETEVELRMERVQTVDEAAARVAKQVAIVRYSYGKPSPAVVRVID
jgi:hypothetical protein